MDCHYYICFLDNPYGNIGGSSKLTDVDHSIWLLVQNVVGSELDKGTGEEEILRQIMVITHGIIDYDSVRHEIARQKRMVVN